MKNINEIKRGQRICRTGNPSDDQKPPFMLASCGVPTTKSGPTMELL